MIAQTLDNEFEILVRFLFLLDGSEMLIYCGIFLALADGFWKLDLLAIHSLLEFILIALVGAIFVSICLRINFELF